MYNTRPKKYNYVNNVDLTPGSEVSNTIVTMIKERAAIAQSKLAHRREVWKEIDSTLNAFVTPEDAAKLEERNTIRNVVVPMNYAMLQTLLTYFTMMYNQSPMFLYGAFGGELRHILGAELLNLEIQRQVDKASMLLNFHTQWRDNYVYGFGAVSPIWVRDTINTLQTKTIGDRKTRVNDEKVIYAGNKLYNISPYDILPDPSVPIEQVQESSFFGFVKHTNLYELLKLDSKDWRDGYVNIDYVKKRFNDRGFISPYSSEYDIKKTNMYQSASYGGSVPMDEASPYSKNIDTVVMYIRIIPKDLKLGAGTQPELWTFVLCDNILIQAMPLGLDHGQIPVTIGAVDYDGYSTTPLSRLEEVQSLQDTINWNFTSHIANVKKSLNGMLVVDPKFVNINDLKSPKPGKIIRMRQAGFGQDVGKAIQQLPVQDVTQNNVYNTSVMTELMRNITAASLNASGGIEKTGERVSASEANNTMRATLSRIDKDAIVFSKQAMDNMGYLLASQTIQMMDEEHWIRTNKKNFINLKKLYDKNFDEQTLALDDYGYVQINHDLIDVNFDVVCNDSNLTGMGDTGEWINLYQIMSQSPELAQQFDMFRIFEHIAKKMGAKNIEVFRRNINDLQAQTMPTEQVKSQVQAGNLVPMSGV